MSSEVALRPATPADVGLIHSLIVELATYERAPDEVTGTPELLHVALFGPVPSAEAMIAELDDEPAGFAVFHGTFSTWECRPGIWLEDLYVRPEVRHGGVGARLVAAVARVALERGCSRLEWNVLGWNEPALRFYSGLGAQRLSDWELHRLDREALRQIAGR